MAQAAAQAPGYVAAPPSDPEGGCWTLTPVASVDTRKIVLIAAPILAIITGAFAFYQLFLGGISLRAHSYPFAAFYGLMGVAGLAIASSLWRARKRV